jgi:hypothetical protein
VVREKGFRRADHLVPVNWIVETTPHLIRLSGTKNELAEVEPFTETQHIWVERPRYEDIPFRVVPFPVRNETTMASVERKRIPPGELAVHRGARVKATDGHVGRVDEFLVDPANGHITHLVLRERHLWGQKDVTVPVSGIDHFEKDTVNLRLDKRTIESLPAVPARRRNDR